VAVVKECASLNGSYEWKQACEHLHNIDPVIGRLIKLTGPCTLQRSNSHFATLCKAIVSQQLSSPAAATVFSRLAALYPHKRVTASRILSTLHSELLNVGLSKRKVEYLHSLSEHFMSGIIDCRKMTTMANEEVIQTLLSVRGIGRWTAEMFLIFSLNRSDVFPVDDLAIKRAILHRYGFASAPSERTILSLTQQWHPYQSIACWYLWRSLDLKL
jgi:DNA-3-methyladenine glycosylase II